MQRVIKGVTDVQHTCHIGRWDHDGEGFIARLVRPCFECVRCFPSRVNAGFCGLRVECLVNRHDMRSLCAKAVLSNRTKGEKGGNVLHSIGERPRGFWSLFFALHGGWALLCCMVLIGITIAMFVNAAPGQPVQASLLQEIGIAVSGLGSVIGLRVSAVTAAVAIRIRKFGNEQTAQVTDITDGYLFWVEADGDKGRSLRQATSTLSTISVGDTIDIYRGNSRSWWKGDVGSR